MIRRILTGLLLVVLSGPALGQEQEMDDGAREEAHRTILRRFSASEKAKTAELGLPDEATAFMDLYFDHHRNYREVRAGRAPRGGRFMGTAHAMWKPGEKEFRFSANFVVFVIDSVTVPYEQVPAVVEATLRDDFSEKVSVAVDGDGGVGLGGLVLLSDLLARVCADRAYFEKLGEPWQKAVEKALLAVVKNLDAFEDRDRFAPLGFLKAFGDDTAAAALIEKIKAAPQGDPMRATLIRTVCGMKGPRAAGFLKDILRGRDDADKSAALSGASALDEEGLGLVGKFLGKDSKESEAVRRSAIHALERVRSGAAGDLLEKTFADLSPDTLRFDAAAALARLGRSASRPYLEATLSELEKKEGDRNAMGRASFIRRLLDDLKKNEGEGK